MFALDRIEDSHDVHLGAFTMGNVMQDEPHIRQVKPIPQCST